MNSIDDLAIRAAALLGAASLKALAILLVAFFVTLMMRHASGAKRHLIWTLAIASTIAVPVLELVLPALSVPLLPRHAPAPVSAISQAVIPSENHPHIIDQTIPRSFRTEPTRDISNPPQPPVRSWPQPSTDNLVSSPVAESAPLASHRHSLAFWLILAWAAGAIAIGVFGAVGAWAARRAGRMACQAGDGSLRAMFHDLLRDLAIRRPVKLLLASETAMPITWGIFRPRILLPSEAEKWPPEHTRAVLLHELGHIRRWDCATRLLALVACAIYWFNPLAWLAASRTRIESERACDDIVIGRGSSATAYAEYLVLLARNYRARRMQNIVAVAMARRSGLADRVKAILNANIDRTELNRRAVAISLALVFVLLMPLSAIHLIHKSSLARAADTTQPATQPSADQNLPPLPDRFSAKRVALRVLSPAGDPMRIDSIQSIYVWIPQGQWMDGPTPQVLDRFAGGWVFVDKQMLALARPGQRVDLTFVTGQSSMTVSAKFPTGTPKKITFEALAGFNDISVDLSAGPAAANDEIAGLVVDPDGKPVAGTEVSFDGPPVGRESPITTGADGVFRLPGKPWFLYLKVSKPNYATRFLTDVPIGHGFTVHLDNHTRLKGQFFGSNDLPAANADVQLVTSKATRRQGMGDDQINNLILTTTTDAHGNYDLPLEPGEYELRVTAANGNGRYEHVEVPSGQTISFSQKLGAGVTLKVVAIDTLTNKPVSGLQFHIMDEKGPAWSGERPDSERTTDSTGTAQWDKLMPGDLEVQPMTDVYSRWWTDESARQGPNRGIDELHLHLKDGMSPVTVHMEPGVYATGTVLSPDGKPVAGADVNIAGLTTGDERYSRRTNAAGKFSLTFPIMHGPWNDSNEPVKYAIVASDPNHRWANAVGDWFTPVLGKTFPMVLKMPAGARVRGRFVGPDGKPVADVLVRARAADNLDTYYNDSNASSDARGRFDLGPMRAANYTIYFAGDQQAIWQLNNLPSLKIAVADGDHLELGDIKYTGAAPQALPMHVQQNSADRAPVPLTDDPTWHPVATVLIPPPPPPAPAPEPVRQQVQQRDSEVLPLEEPLPGTPAPPGNLSGKVVDESSKPIPGVAITIWARDHADPTDAEGHFSVTGLPTNRAVEIRFSKAGFCPRYIPIQPAGLSGVVVTLTNKTYFEGVVKDPAGMPVAGAKIRGNQGRKQLDRMVTDYVWTETISDANGHYRLYVQPDSYDIQVRVPAVGVVRTGKLPIADGRTNHLDLNLTPGITFHARVVDSINDKPVPGVRLWSNQDPGVEGTSDPAGNLIISSMVPGVISFDVDAKGYARWWSDLADKEWERQLDTRNGNLPWNWNDLEYDITDNMPVASIVVEPETRITGVVVDPDGNPVSGASVCIADTGTNRAIAGNEKYSVVTGGGGTFQMTLPASETHGFNLFAHDGAHGKWRKYANGVLPIIHTNPGDHLTDIKLTLTRAATVRGRVVDDAGNPVPNRQIRAVPTDLLEDMNNEPKTTTDQNGNFELKFVRPTTQMIEVAPFVMRVDRPPPDGTFATVNLSDGQTLDGVTLTAMPGDDE